MGCDMRILLDTHILAWAHTDDSRLSAKARDVITDKNNIVYYSPLSIWEAEIKHTAHPNDFPFSSKRLDELCRISDMAFLPLLSEHIFALHTLHYSLSAPRPHKDPFDRMLICQAKVENMKLLTHDSLIPYYEEDCVISV